MDDPLRAEVLGVARRVADVVLVREEDVCDPAHPLERDHQLLHVPRRIDQPVAIRMANDIAVRAERLLRVKPVVADIVFNQHREAVSGSTHHSLVGYQGADRAHGTGQERLIGLVTLGLALRLAIDGRVLAILDERLRRQLPAGVAVDAGGVYEEVAIDIRREPFGDISHSVSPLCDGRSRHLPFYHTYSYILYKQRQILFYFMPVRQSVVNCRKSTMG